MSSVFVQSFLEHWIDPERCEDPDLRGKETPEGGSPYDTSQHSGF